MHKIIPGNRRKICCLGLFVMYQTVENSVEICMENFCKCNQFTDTDIVSSGLNLGINTSGCRKITQLQLCYDLLLSKIGGISQFAKIISDGNIINLLQFLSHKDFTSFHLHEFLAIDFSIKFSYNCNVQIANKEDVI